MSQGMLFLRAAEFDLEDACRWYERRSEGLGSNFLRSAQDALDTIQHYPRIHPAVHDEVRRAQVASFPYSIFYVFEEQSILIIGVFHNSRDPNQWLSRL